MTDYKYILRECDAQRERRSDALTWAAKVSVIAAALVVILWSSR